MVSGWLTGKFSADHTFPADDHRAFNRNGEQFNVGDFAKGVELAKKFGWIAETRGTMARVALRRVRFAIPGFKSGSKWEAMPRPWMFPISRRPKWPESTNFILKKWNR